MKRSFGQFKKTIVHGLPSADRALLHAFNKGAEAGRKDDLRRSPYLPTTEQEKSEAWLCGYDEVHPRYRVRK